MARDTDRGLVGLELVVEPRDARPDLIRFSGELSEFGREFWVVAGRKVLIADDTQIRGEPFLGATVHVVARDTDRGLVAVELVVEPAVDRAPQDRPSDRPRKGDGTSDG